MQSYYFLILLIFLTACSGGKSTSRKLEVSFGAISTEQPTMLYGQKVNSTEKFSRKLDSDTTSIVLSNGTWRFHAIYWDYGANYTEGDPKCGFEEKTLTDSTSVISLTPSKVGCTETAWMGPHQWTQSGDIMFWGLELNICPAGSSSTFLAPFAPCADYAHGATGLKVILPEYTGLTKTMTNSIETACYPVGASNNLNLPAKIPFGINADFPMYTIAKIYYAPPGCSGSGCCSGIEQDYHFPNGFGNALVGGNSAAPTNGDYRRVKLEQRGNKHLSITINSAVYYAPTSCEPFTVALKDAENNTVTTPSNLALTLNCVNCAMFHDDACTTPASPAQVILAATSSYALYMKPTGAKPKVTAALLSNPDWFSAVAEPFLLVTYGDADANFLNNVTALTDLSQLAIDPNNLSAGNFIVYETVQGNRGKMEIVSYTPDTIVFNYETFGTANVSGSSKTITACSSGSCYLDFDIVSPVTSYDPGSSDFKYDDAGGTYIFPQGPNLMLKIY